MTCRRGKISALLFFVTLVALIIPVSSAYALDKYWIGSAGGSFSDDANWATVAGPCGGVSDTTAPVVDDTIYFTSTCTADITLDAPVDIMGIRINAGYNGVLTQAPGISITVDSLGWRQFDGTFQGADADISVGYFLLNGGNYYATTGTIFVQGNWSIFASAIFDAGSGSVQFDGFSSQTIVIAGSGVAIDDIAVDFNNMRISNTLGGVQLTGLAGAELEVDGVLTIDNGATLRMVGKTLDLNGILANNGVLELYGTEQIAVGTMDSDSGTVRYTGITSATIPSVIFAYYNLDLDEIGASDPIYTLPDVNLTVNGLLSVTDATLAFDNDKNLTALGGITVAAQGALTNSGIGDLVLGGDVNNAGTITFDAYGFGPGDANDISITSSVPGTRRNWQGAGTFSFADIDVTDQSVTGGSPASILDSSGSGSNNINWHFGGVESLSGTVYNNKTKLTSLNNKNLRLNLNGNVYTTISNGSGVYSFNNLLLSSGMSAAIYLSGEVEKGSLLYVSDGNSAANLEPVQDTVQIRDDSGTPFVNADIVNPVYIIPGVPDFDQMTTYSSWWTLSKELWIPSGQEFIMSDQLTTYGVDIDGTLRLSGQHILVTGNWDASGGIFDSAGGDVSIGWATMTTGGIDDDHDFDNLYVYNGDLAIAAGSDLRVNNLLFIFGLRTLNNSSNRSIYLGGDWTNWGTFSSGTGTVYFEGDGDFSTTGGGTKSLYNVEVSGVLRTNSAFDVNGALTIQPGGVLDNSGNNSAINVAGNWVNSGTFTSGTSTVTLDGGGSTISAGGSGIGVDDVNNDFHNLVIASTTTATSEIEIDGTLTINTAIWLLMNHQPLDLNGTLSIIGDLVLEGDESVEIGTMDTNSGAVRYVGLSTTLPASIPEYNALRIDSLGNEFTLPDVNVIVRGGLYIQKGSLKFDDDKNLTVYNTVPVVTDITGGSLINRGTGDFFVSDRVRVWPGSSIDFDSGLPGPGDPDGIQIRSTSAGTRMRWEGGGTVNMTDVDVQDQWADGWTITASDSTNSGNNVNWIFDAAPDAISGVAYTSKTEAATLNNKKLRLVHYNGAIRTSFDTVTDGSGNFSFNAIALQPGDPLIIFVNDEAEEGNLVYVSDGNPVANLKLYQNELAIRTDFGAGLTNTQITSVDDGDADIHYNIAGGNATFETAYELYIFSGSTYLPGGTVSGGAFDLNGTFDAAGFDVTVNGNWDATGGAYISGANMTTFAGALNVLSGGIDDNHDFNDITISSGSAFIAQNTDIDGDILISAGAQIYMACPQMTVAGNWTTLGSHHPLSNSVVLFDGVSILDSANRQIDQVRVSGSVTLASALNTDTGVWILPGGTLDNSAGQDITVDLGWTNDGTFIAGNSTVYIDSNTTIDAQGTGIGVDDTGKDFFNLTIQGAAYLASELEVDGILTIVGGQMLNLGGSPLDLNGTLANNGDLFLIGSEAVEIGVMDIDSGTVRYTGTASTTIPSGITTYFNLDFDESGTSDPTYTLPNVDIAVNGALSVTDGTLALSPANNLSVTGATTVAAAGILQNSGTGDLILGGDISNSGAITFDSSGAGPGDADDIQIRSTVPGTRRNWQGAGSFSMTDIDVQDQSVIGGTPASISVTSGTNSGNNVNWFFDTTPESVSGVAYNGKAEAGTLNNKKLRLVHNNGSYNTTYDTLTDGAGAFTVSPLDLQPGDALLLFVNDEAEVANLAYVSDGNSVADLKLYQNEFAIRTDFGAGLTNAQLAALDDGDTDIRYAVSGGNGTFETAYELYIFSGSTYLPGGTVSGGAFDLNGTLDVAGFDVTVNGNWDATGGAYISGLNTTTFHAGTVVAAGTDDNHDFYNLTVGSGAVLLFLDTDTDGDLYVNSGASLQTWGGTHTVAGNWTTLGTHNPLSTGTVLFDGTTNLDIRGQELNSVYISGSVAVISSFTVDIGLVINLGGVLDDTAGVPFSVDTYWGNNGTFIAGTSTVTIDSATIDGNGTGVLVDDSGKDFYNLVITNLSTLSSELEVDGSLTVSSGTLRLNGYDLDLNGTLFNNSVIELQGSENLDIATMDTDSGIVRYTGTASTTIPSGITTYFNLDFDESGTSDPIYTLPAADITVNGALSVTDGIMAFNPVNNLTVTGIATVAAAGSISNTGIGDLILGNSVSNSGTITFDSSGAGPGDADDIQIRSSVPGTRRNWQGTGIFSMTDVDVQDQSVIGGTPANISVTNGTNSGNNVNWFFDAVPESLGGTVYNGKAESGTLNNKKLRVIHSNGSYNTTYDTVTDGAGTFTVSPLDLQPGDALLLFINDEAEAGNLAYVSDGNSVANLKLYQNEFVIRTDFGTGLTNAQLAALDDGDTDIRYAISAGNATFETAYELYIFSGSTYLPGGTVSGGAFNINGTLDAAGFDVTVNGNWDATGGAYISGLNMTTFAATLTIITGGIDDSHDFHNVTFSGVIQFSTNDLDVDGNLLITPSGDVTSFGSDFYIAGNWTNSGDFNAFFDTVIFDGVTLLDAGGFLNAKTFRHIRVEGVVTLVNSNLQLYGDMHITGTGTLSDANNLSLNIFGNWLNEGIFDSGTGSVFFGGTSNTIDAGGTGIGFDDTDKDFYIVGLSNATISLVNTELEVDSSLSLNIASTLSLAGQDLSATVISNSGGIVLNGDEAVSGIMAPIFGTVRYVGTSSVTIPSAFGAYYNLQFDESGTSNPTYTLPNVDITVNGTLSVTDGTLALGPLNNLTVNGTATIAATGSLQNIGTGDLILGSSLSNSGTITFDSSGAGPGDADDIQIRSTVPGTRRNWQGIGTFSMTDVDVQDQSVIGGTPASINVTNGTNSGNNVNWFFDTVADSIGGTVYNGKAEAATLNNKKLRVIHNNGSYNTTYDTVTDGVGAFTVSPLNLQPGDALLLFVNDEAEVANLAYVSDGNSVGNLKVYQNEFAIRTDAGAGLINAQLAVLDDGDTDIRYAVSGGNATFETAYELYIFSGSIYLPTGQISCGAIDISGTLDANGFDVTVAGNWSVNGSYLSGLNTTIFTGVGSLGAFSTADNKDFHNVTFTGAGSNRTLPFPGVADIDGDVLINPGATFTIGSLSSLWVAGDWTNNGTFDCASGYVHFDGNTLLDSGGVANGQHRFRSLYVDGIVTPVSNDIYVTRHLSIGAAGQLINSNNLNITVVQNWQNDGVFVSGTGTVTLKGGISSYISPSAGGAANDNNDFYNLVIDTTSAAYTLISGELEVDNSLSIAAGRQLILDPATIGLRTNGSFQNDGILTVISDTVLPGLTLANPDIDSGMIQYLGSGLTVATLSSGVSAYFDIEFAESGVGETPAFHLADTNLDVHGTFTVNDASSLVFDDDKSLIVRDSAVTGTALSIAVNASLTNTGTGDLTLGGAVSNSGTISLDSYSLGGGDADDILIR
ncbi:MAG: hypothetical protein PHC51_08545, partial [bacterium]|nr:hypothetical protein [bacterium]